MKKLTFLSLLAITSALFITSCGPQAVSSTTGWTYNDPSNGGFYVSPYTEQITAPGLVFIEGGTFTMGRVVDDTRYEWDNVERRITVSSFYLDECEVSNVNYREYIHWLDRVFGTDYPEKVRKAYPDTNVWRKKLALEEKMVSCYFQFSNFNDYPVVGVSWEQACAFARWRTDRVNEQILIDMGHWAPDFTEITPTNAFQTDVYFAGRYDQTYRAEGLPNLDPRNIADAEGRDVRRDDGILIPYYRLPTEAEWEFAALGLIGNTVDERIYERKIYPWNGNFVRADNKENYGQIVANFKRSRGDNMGVAGSLNDAFSYTSPVRWYFPNDYGLYNMAGNVSEWCLDVYRKVTISDDAQDNNPFRGNVYKTYTIQDEEVLIDDNSGEIVYKDIDDDLNRRNYQQADNIAFLDGDRNSSIDNTDWTGGKDAPAGEEEIVPEETPAEVDYTSKVYNPTKTLITNKIRVVKGGSWTDRAYWLNPSTRRYYEQDRSTDWIGFRCAMDRIGSDVQGKQ